MGEDLMKGTGEEGQLHGTVGKVVSGILHICVGGETCIYVWKKWEGKRGH